MGFGIGLGSFMQGFAGGVGLGSRLVGLYNDAQDRQQAEELRGDMRQAYKESRASYDERVRQAMSGGMPAPQGQQSAAPAASRQEPAASPEPAPESAPPAAPRARRRGVSVEPIPLPPPEPPPVPAATSPAPEPAAPTPAPAAETQPVASGGRLRDRLDARVAQRVADPASVGFQNLRGVFPSSPPSAQEPPVQGPEAPTWRQRRDAEIAQRLGDNPVPPGPPGSERWSNRARAEVGLPPITYGQPPEPAGPTWRQRRDEQIRNLPEQQRDRPPGYEWWSDRAIAEANANRARAGLPPIGAVPPPAEASAPPATAQEPAPAPAAAAAPVSAQAEPPPAAPAPRPAAPQTARASGGGSLVTRAQAAIPVEAPRRDPMQVLEPPTPNAPPARAAEPASAPEQAPAPAPAPAATPPAAQTAPAPAALPPTRPAARRQARQAAPPAEAAPAPAPAAAAAPAPAAPSTQALAAAGVTPTPPAAPPAAPGTQQWVVAGRAYTNKDEATRAAEATVGSFMDHYMRVGAPQVVERMLAAGRVDQARQFQTWIRQEGVQRGMRDWSRAIVAAQAGDADGFARHLAAAYNNNEYSPDGISIVNSRVIRDAQGGIGGMEVTLRGANGQTRTETFNGAADLYRRGIAFMAPEQQFQFYNQELATARQVATSLAREGRANSEHDRRTVMQAGIQEARDQRLEAARRERLAERPRGDTDAQATARVALERRTLERNNPNVTVNGVTTPFMRLTPQQQDEYIRQRLQRNSDISPRPSAPTATVVPGVTFYTPPTAAPSAR